MSERPIVRVVSYAGWKGEERPMAFYDGDGEHRVLEIQERWVESDALSGGSSKWYFRVKADDGKEYLLSHDATKKQWCLDT
jgi:hypothetical protein